MEVQVVMSYGLCTARRQPPALILTADGRVGAFNFRKPAEKSYINIIYWVNTEETWLVPCTAVRGEGGGWGGYTDSFVCA